MPPSEYITLYSFISASTSFTHVGSVSLPKNNQDDDDACKDVQGLGIFKVF